MWTSQMSNNKTDQKLRRNIVLTSFEAVAKIEEMKNKWFDSDIWAEMIRTYYNTINNGRQCDSNMVSSLSNKQIKYILGRSQMMNVGNLSIANPNGYYMMSRRVTKRKHMEESEEGNAQYIRAEIQAILVTGKGISSGYI